MGFDVFTEIIKISALCKMMAGGVMKVIGILVRTGYLNV
jgi:hypothetical protein